MDWLTFISKLVEALAWPAVVVGVLWFLKEHLPELARSVRKLKFSDLEVEFGKEASQLAAETQRVLPDARTKGDPEVVRLRGIAEISPRAAIVEAWVKVEQAAAAVVKKGLLRLPASPGPLQLLRALKQLDVLTPPQVSAFEHLRSLRNMAVHGTDMEVTPEAVNDYIVSAVAMAGYLEDTVDFITSAVPDVLPSNL